MKVNGRIKKFLEGVFDYENPSAGCCKSISAIPGVEEEYKRKCEGKGEMREE